jgi:hypothetical protein
MRQSAGRREPEQTVTPAAAPSAAAGQRLDQDFTTSQCATAASQLEGLSS